MYFETLVLELRQSVPHKREVVNTESELGGAGRLCRCHLRMIASLLWVASIPLG